MVNAVRDLALKKADVTLEQQLFVSPEKDTHKWANTPRLSNRIDELQADGLVTKEEAEQLHFMLDVITGINCVEDECVELIETVMQEEPLYTKWLESVSGIGVKLSARLITEVGYCEEFESTKELWECFKFTPEDACSEPEFVEVLVQSMIRMGEASEYKREYYDPYKQRLIDNDAGKNKAHRRASEYTAKMFLTHYFEKCKELR